MKESHVRRCVNFHPPKADENSLQNIHIIHIENNQKEGVKFRLPPHQSLLKTLKFIKKRADRRLRLIHRAGAVFIIGIGAGANQK